MRAFFPTSEGRGEKIPHEGGLAVLHLSSQNFLAPGGGMQRSPRAPSRRGNHAGAPKRSAVFAAPPVNFRRSFSAVAAVAQALEVRAVGEHRPISAVIRDMIHIRCPSPDPTLRTRTAPWLMQKLRWPQILEPDIRAIHPAPRLGRLTAPVTAGFMLVTVSGRSQRMASGMAAQPHRFVCQGYHLLAKQKTPAPNDRIPFGTIMGSGVLRSGLLRYPG